MNDELDLSPIHSDDNNNHSFNNSFEIEEVGKGIMDHQDDEFKKYIKEMI